MTAFRSETVDTPAGKYTVELHTDHDPMNPLTDYDHEGMAFYIVGNRNGVMTDTLGDAGDAGDALRTWINAEHSIDEIEHRFALWKSITGNPWILVTGNGFDWHESWGWLILVNTSATYVANDGNSYPSLPNPIDTAQHTMDDYQTWSRGEVCGYVVKSPNGDDVESVWGFYDDDEALEQGKTVAEYDALDRLDAANLAGAGFIGIV